MADQLQAEPDRWTLSSRPSPVDFRPFPLILVLTGGLAIYLQLAGGDPEAWLLPYLVLAMGPFFLVGQVVSSSQQEQVVFSEQGLRWRRTTLGIGRTRHFGAERIQSLRLEPEGYPAPCALVFEDRRTGDLVRLASFESRRALVGIYARLAERFPHYAEKGQPLLFSSRFRLIMEPSRAVLVLRPASRLPWWVLGAIGLGAATLARGAFAETILAAGVAAMAVSLMGLGTASRRERVILSNEGCRLSTTYLGLGAGQLFESDRVRGLRLEGHSGKWAHCMVFDDVKSGRTVSFAEDLALDPALGRVYAALAERFPRFVEDAQVPMPLSRVRVEREADLVRFSFVEKPPWVLAFPRPPFVGEVLEFDEAEIRHRSIHPGYRGGGWRRHERTLPRADVLGVRLAPMQDYRGTTVHGPQLFHGIEIVPTRGDPLRMGGLLDETESRALLMRHASWRRPLKKSSRMPGSRSVISLDVSRLTDLLRQSVVAP
ncbi:MAG: hypothetical protein HY319_03555 [Armatimonadetes bacterium]|nr:hypothetical protein [Armatimonadota bacterium]